MESRQYTSCSETQNQEKYICLNKECYSSKKKQLHCHECLVKIHRTDKNSIRHFDQFVTIDAILNDLQRRNNKKLDQFNLLLHEAHQFKKAKFQELCSLKSFSSKSSEFQNQIYQRIETIVEEVPKSLNAQVTPIKQALQFSKEKLPFLVESYLSNDTKFQEALKSVYADLTQKVEDYISSIELSDSSTIKKKIVQQLQKRVLDLENKNCNNNNAHFGPTHLACTVMVITLLYLIYTIQELNQKIMRLEYELLLMRQENKQSFESLLIDSALMKQQIMVLHENFTTLSNQQGDQKSSLVNVQEALISQELKFNHKLSQLSKKQDEEFGRLNNTMKNNTIIIEGSFAQLLEQHSKEQSKMESLKLDLTNALNYIQAPEKDVYFRDYSDIIRSSYIRDRLILGQQLNFTKVKMLYSSNRHGLNKKAFWEKISNQGPTLLIARFHNNFIVGAFSNARWMALRARAGDYMRDPQGISYLFSYNKDQIFMVKDLNYTIYSKYLVGPQFGQGPDLSLQGDYFDQCSSNIGNTYYMTGVSDRSNHMMNGSPKIMEMEVFLLSS